MDRKVGPKRRQASITLHRLAGPQLHPRGGRKRRKAVIYVSNRSSVFMDPAGLLSCSLHLSLNKSGVPRNFVRGECSTHSVEDRGQGERGSGGGSPLVRGSGSSCNLVQEISFNIVKFS